MGFLRSLASKLPIVGNYVHNPDDEMPSIITGQTRTEEAQEVRNEEYSTAEAEQLLVVAMQSFDLQEALLSELKGEFSMDAELVQRLDATSAHVRSARAKLPHQATTEELKEHFKQFMERLTTTDQTIKELEQLLVTIENTPAHYRSDAPLDLPTAETLKLRNDQTRTILLQLKGLFQNLAELYVQLSHDAASGLNPAAVAQGTAILNSTLGTVLALDQKIQTWRTEHIPMAGEFV